jgi:hypothetical protein
MKTKEKISKFYERKRMVISAKISNHALKELPFVEHFTKRLINKNIKHQNWAKDKVISFRTDRDDFMKNYTTICVEYNYPKLGNLLSTKKYGVKR